LIPPIAAGIFWFLCRGQVLKNARPEPWGLAVILLATVMRLAGAYFYVNPLDHLSLLVFLAGACLLCAGWPCLARGWPAFAFLLFMIPIPATLGGSDLVGGLQTVGSVASTYALQTLGVTAYREGNVIILQEGELGIVEACSGVRMLMVFCALSTATAILLPYGWKRRTVIIASAVPLALVCNVARITVAGIASENLGTEVGHFIFHDLAGWLMVPFAFGLLALELYLLRKMFQPAADNRAPSAALLLPVDRRQARARPSTAVRRLAKT
jgi:exosortase